MLNSPQGVFSISGIIDTIQSSVNVTNEFVCIIVLSMYQVLKYHGSAILAGPHNSKGLFEA